MYPWRGVVIHMIFVLTQPTYLVLRYLINNEYFNSVHKTWLTITVISWIYIVTQISIPFFSSPLHRIPSPPGERFPIGHLNFNGGRPMTDLISNMLKTPNDGLLLLWKPLYLGCRIIPTHPDTLMEILNTHNYDWEKPGLIKIILSRVVGEGLVNAEGDEHKTMRRIVTPSFSGRHIRTLVPLFYAKGLAFGNALARAANSSADGCVEMMNELSRVTLDIIGAAGVGKDFNTIDNNEDRLANLYATIVHTDRNPLWLFMLVTLLAPRWILRRLTGTSFATIEDAQVELREGVRALIQEKKQKVQEKVEQEGDIIATIMKSGEMSDDKLIAQLLTFLAAGHDTTASALSWTFWLLSTQPNIQTKLCAECVSVLSNKDVSEIDASDLDSKVMPYLTAVCNESLRLYPPAPAIGRHAVRPTTVGGWHLPKGTGALIAPWAINRNPSLWGDDANIFKPDRWLEGPNAATGGATSPLAFISFLHGPRSCIAQSFARMEMKCLLATFVTRFSFELADPNEEVEIGGFLTIKPKDGLRLRLHDLKS